MKLGATMFDDEDAIIAEGTKKLIDEINRKFQPNGPLQPPSDLDALIALIDAADALKNETGARVLKATKRKMKRNLDKTKAEFMASLQDPSFLERPTKEDFIRAMKDPAFLPTREELLRHFSEDKPFGGNSQIQFITMCFNEANPIFDVYTAEYIGALAHYIFERCEGRQTPTSPVILEVGAGTGRLTHFLQKALPGFNFIATDDLSYGIPTDGCDVRAHTYQNALIQYRPEIVISAWMPYTEDWTQAFRDCPSVKEYILIGETDEGCCGHSWLTWGCSDEGDPTFTSVPPYKADGFTRHNLNNISAMQICRTDMLCYDFPILHSRTVSFRRK